MLCHSWARNTGRFKAPESASHKKCRSSKIWGPKPQLRPPSFALRLSTFAVAGCLTPQQRKLWQLKQAAMLVHREDVVSWTTSIRAAANRFAAPGRTLEHL